MILMPSELTAENGAKAALIAEFQETFTHECPECEGCGLGPASPHTQGETRCEVCGGAGEIFERIPVEWTTIKEIYKRAVALLGKSQDEAIAEAVAAERERIIRLMEKRISQFSGDYRRYIRKTEARGILRFLLGAIRSAAK